MPTDRELLQHAAAAQDAVGWALTYLRAGEPDQAAPCLRRAGEALEALAGGPVTELGVLARWARLRRAEAVGGEAQALCDELLGLLGAGEVTAGVRGDGTPPPVRRARHG